MSDVNDRPAMLSDLHELKTELKTDINELKTDVAELKTDVAVLKTDVAELKTGLTELKTDVAELKTGLTELKTELPWMFRASQEEFRTWFAAYVDKTKAVEERHDRVVDEIATQRRELDAHRADATVHRIPKRTRRR